MKLETFLSGYPPTEDYVIEALRDYQSGKDDHCVTEAEIVRFADYFDITESKVCGIVSFYSYLSAEPKARYVIRVCKDVPCFVNGSESVLKTLENRLGIKAGETTEDRMFTIEQAGCLGHCDHSPCMRVNEKTFHDLTPDKIKAILSECREEKS